MPRKIKKSSEDIIKTLKELAHTYNEILELQDKLNQEVFLVNQEMEKSILDIKQILSKL